jgi:hypothetical protein
MSRHCERSEAIQGPERLPLDGFVAPLLSMTDASEPQSMFV